MMKVLVVDDDADVLALLKKKLESGKRYTVIQAEGGEEGVAAAIEEKPDIVLCDIDMPDMDGITVAEKLANRESTKKIPLIFLSSIVTPKDVKRGATAGQYPMMSKQSSLQELVLAIEAATATPKG